MHKFIFASALLATAIVTSPLRAADTVVSGPTGLYRVSTIESLKVFNRSGDNLGKIKDLVLDARTGKVSYAVLDFGGFLGVGDKYFAVPWHAFKYEMNNNEERLVLDVTKDRLKNAPGFDSKHWPNMADPTFSQGIEKFYGPEPTARR
jgi:sporulation protein YlmC with PRC-barrel domain